MTPDIIHVVINPASGSRKAFTTYTEHVLPYIRSAAPTVRIVEHETKAEGDGVHVARRIIAATASAEAADQLAIVLLGGDGTTHEVLNGLVETEADGRHSVSMRTRLAIVPTGTANALYASLYARQEGSKLDEDKLRSLRSLFSAGTGQDHPLSLSAVVTRVTSSQSRVTLAHLIASHALHASILSDSETLRNEHPGIERFKLAFAQNRDVWVTATLKLTPLLSGEHQGHVLRYDPRAGTFVKTEAKILSDAFLYFACLTTDRLEPAFVPAPFSGPDCERKEMQRPADAVDVLIYRPSRSPALKEQYSDVVDASFWSSQDGTPAREKIGSTHLMQISSFMYQEGKHVDLTYSTDADVDSLEIAGEGDVVCEYYRCAGYTWTPLDSRARRVCIDGTVLEADETQVRVLGRDEGAGKIVVCR